MYKTVFKYLLFAISSCIACKSKSVPRRLYQPGAALGFSFSCWEAQAGWCAETRGLLWARMWELWGCGQPRVHGGLCFSVPGFLDKMYERHKRRYSLCDISKVDRTVDVVLLKVWCLYAFICGFPSLSPGDWSVLCCICVPSGMMQRGGTGRSTLALQHGGSFECYQTISCLILLSLQLDNLLWHAVFGRAPWLSSLPSALKQSLVWNFRWVFCVRWKGFPFPVLAFEAERHVLPKRCILPKKGTEDPPLPLFFVCIRMFAVSLVVWVWFCLRMGWSKNQEWLLANCPSVFLL